SGAPSVCVAPAKAGAQPVLPAQEWSVRPAGEVEQPTRPVGRSAGSSLVAASRQVHNLKVAGSNPAPATNANLSAAKRRAKCLRCPGEGRGPASSPSPPPPITARAPSLGGF